MQTWKFLKTQRSKRGSFKFPISIFSIVLLCFAFIYSLLLIFTIVTSYECQYGLLWIEGWFEGRSLFQIFACSAAAFAAIFLIRIIFYRSELNLGEAVLQAALVCTLIVVMPVQKAFLFPYATPSWAQFLTVYNLYSSQKVLLVEEFDPIYLYADWKYDFPPPPPYGFEDNPRISGKHNRRLATIFLDSKSPLWSEVKALRQCSVDMNQAIQEWEKNQILMEEYWEEYGDWYALNRWRYGE